MTTSPPLSEANPVVPASDYCDPTGFSLQKYIKIEDKIKPPRMIRRRVLDFRLHGNDRHRGFFRRLFSYPFPPSTGYRPSSDHGPTPIPTFLRLQGEWDTGSFPGPEFDDFVKSPYAALRCILRHCGVRKSTPHSSGFARLASGAFYEVVPGVTRGRLLTRASSFTKHESRYPAPSTP